MPVFDAQQSKIKMVILTKNNFENPVWYSPIKQNKHRTESIITSMLRRFEKSKWLKFTNIIQFYENGTLIAVKKL